MKKKYLIITILFVTVIIPFQLQAQSTDVFKQEGIASWYGREFEGRPTASGEIFDSSQLTAAHPSLPFGTRLIVTNQHNNKSVTVRVNDRGPFVPARIIDVSRAAAEQLDMIITGTAPVTVVSIDRIVISTPAVGAQVSAAPAVAAPVIISAPSANVQSIENSARETSLNAAPVATQPVIVQIPAPQFKLIPELVIAPDKNYRLQVGSFRISKNAVDAFDKLKNAGLNPAYEKFINSDNIEYYRVVLSGVQGIYVQATAEIIAAAGFKEVLIKEE